MKHFFICLAALFFSTVALAQNIQYSGKDGIAIKGYDPVAYFLFNKPAEGNDAFSFNWSGSKWKFSSQENLDSFKLAPQKYAPQYGGYCAYGLSENHKTPTDPLAWTIIDDKLYLNYNMKVKAHWLKDTSARIQAANGYWPALNN